jgi:hypothetical protein
VNTSANILENRHATKSRRARASANRRRPRRGREVGAQPTTPLPLDAIATSLRQASVGVYDRRSGAHGAGLYWERADEVFHCLAECTRFRVHSLAWDIEIDSAWSVTIETTLEIAAVDVPVTAICMQRESQNVAMVEFEDLQVYAVDGAQQALPWIPATNQPNMKGFIVFLRKPLLPGESPIIVTTRTSWHEAARRLNRTNGFETQDLAFPRGVLGAVDRARINLALPIAGGKRYRIQCPNPKVDLSLPQDGGSRTATIELNGSSAQREIHIRMSRLG